MKKIKILDVIAVFGMFIMVFGLFSCSAMYTYRVDKFVDEYSNNL